MRTTPTAIASFLAGIAVAGAGAAMASSINVQTGPAEVRCHTWANRTTQQCVVNFTKGDPDHLRVTTEVDGEWLMIDDLWPANLDRRPEQRVRGAR